MSTRVNIRYEYLFGRINRLVLDSATYRIDVPIDWSYYSITLHEIREAGITVVVVNQTHTQWRYLVGQYIRGRKN